MYPKSETEGGKRRVPIRYLDLKVSGSYSRVGRGASSVSDPRRVLSSGMHKILRWRQRVGQLLYPIPASLSSLSLLTDRPTTCLFFRPPLRRLSLARTRSLALSTRLIQRQTRIELAGMRIFMRSFMPTRSLKIIPGIEHNERSSDRSLFLGWSHFVPLRDPTKQPTPRPSPFHKRGNTFAGMQMRSLEARGHLPCNHRRNDSTLTQSVGTFLSDLTRI